MCLLMHKPATATITRELADDIYTRNSDGFGILYAEDNLLYHLKTLGDKDEIWKIIEANQHRELLLHWRMRTHGDVDLTNCHPYEVYGDGSSMPVYMMHNGVLSTGNSKDTSKSDTWHYIREWLHPISANDPSVLFTSQMRALISSHIGSSNKFGMMNHLGEVSICNRSSGVDHAGLWFSNTYAWSAHKFGAVKYTYTGSYTGRSTTYYDDDNWWGKGSTTALTPTKPEAKSTDKPAPTVQPSKRKPGRPRKHKAAQSTSAMRTVHDVLVADLRSLLQTAGLTSVNKAVTDANLVLTLNTLGYSDVVDLINMCEFNEITEDILVDSLRSSQKAWALLYGDSFARTADHYKTALRDNIARARANGMTEAEISQWAAL